MPYLEKYQIIIIIWNFFHYYLAFLKIPNNNKKKPTNLNVKPGTLLLFYGRNYLHRVTPVISKKPRILVTLNYNLEKGIELSINARKTFFGRIK